MGKDIMHGKGMKDGKEMMIGEAVRRRKGAHTIPDQTIPTLSSLLA